MHGTFGRFVIGHCAFTALDIELPTPIQVLFLHFKIEMDILRNKEDGILITCFGVPFFPWTHSSSIPHISHSFYTAGIFES